MFNEFISLRFPDRGESWTLSFERRFLKSKGKVENFPSKKLYSKMKKAMFCNFQSDQSKRMH